MPSIRLSLRSAVTFLAKSPDARALKEIEDAIAKVSRARRPAKEKETHSTKAKGDRQLETAALRAAAMVRSGGRCECCGSRYSLEMDHFFGRARVPQKISNVWILDVACHREKTNNKPSASAWLLHFIAHCDEYGYTAEAATARQRLAYIQAKEAQAFPAPKVRR